jgi:hypothetical protein
MREVIERLENLARPYYITGSEALARDAQPRQTMDLDVVVDISVAELASLAREFEDDFLVNDPIELGDRSMASLVAMSGLAKVDLIIGRDDPWARSAMARRIRWEHPGYGSTWVSSLEDLILAKLEWSGGSSELQLRDARNLVAGNRERIDWAYLERWAVVLGISTTLETIRAAT